MVKNSRPAQDFVPIKEVRDGVVVLTDGSLRAILMVSSINFALKSSNEQEAILLQFQNFLNSLDFPIQIFIQSREQDIRPYIAMLEKRYREQTTELMRIQTREYMEFIKSFVETVDIMTKNFFVIVPYSPSVLEGRGGIIGSIQNTLGLGNTRKKTSSEAGRNFEQQRTQLEQRVSVVEQGVVRTGVRTVQLGTEEVIELFYKQFNPGELEKPISLNQ